MSNLNDEMRLMTDTRSDTDKVTKICPKCQSTRVIGYGYEIFQCTKCNHKFLVK